MVLCVSVCDFACDVGCREAPSMLGKSSNKTELKRKKAEERGGKKVLQGKQKKRK